MNVLYLRIRKKWFDMILSGQKTEEYREIKPFYNNQLKKPITHIRFINGYQPHSPAFTIGVLRHYQGEGVESWGADPGTTYHVFVLDPKTISHEPLPTGAL